MDARAKARTLIQLLETRNKAKLARKLGVAASTVARWGRGETRPSAEHALGLAQELDVPVEWILAEAA